MVCAVLPEIMKFTQVTFKSHLSQGALLNVSLNFKRRKGINKKWPVKDMHGAKISDEGSLHSRSSVWLLDSTKQDIILITFEWQSHHRHTSQTGHQLFCYTPSVFIGATNSTKYRTQIWKRKNNCQTNFILLLFYFNWQGQTDSKSIIIRCWSHSRVF